MSRNPDSPNDTTVESVADAIRQTQPFQSPRHEAVVGLLLTVEDLRRPMQALFGRHGELTQQQYNVLRILRGARPKGLPTLEIVERMIEHTPGITRLIDRLEKKGLVTRERSATDRRQVFCHLTKQGAALLRKLDRPVAALDDQLLAGIDDREVATLIDLLDRVRHHVRRLPSS